MEGVNNSENHLTSAAAFVEGGIQEASDDACSICLEAFCGSDPSTITSCKHEFHLQCILEWCQRSSQCPMCWQPISLNDPSSQELLDVVEQERIIRMNPPRNTTIFHHPTLGDFELQHLPISATDSELEEHIIQHLAAAAAMGRTRHISRRDGHRNRSSAQGRPHFLVFSTQPNASGAATAASLTQRGDRGESPPVILVTGPNCPVRDVAEEPAQQITTPSTQTDYAASASNVISSQHATFSNNLRSPIHSSPNSQNRAGPSDFQSFSESLKSRISAVSTRYKESITKSTRGWKERFFSRNSSMADLGSEVRREVNAGIATVSCMMDHLETRENNTTNTISVPNNLGNSSSTVEGNQKIEQTGGTHFLSETNVQAPFATSSASH